MTRFKFRVWDKEEKHMHYMPAAELYEELFIRADGVLCNVLDGAELSSDPVPVDDRYEVSFDTGLYDCEGKEIWEGDVLRVFTRERHNESFIGVALWDNDKSSFIAKGASENTGYYFFWECPRIKVIGNRFSNSELLEGKE